GSSKGLVEGKSLCEGLAEGAMDGLREGLVEGKALCEGLVEGAMEGLRDGCLDIFCGARKTLAKANMVIVSVA
ncbi:hypothetical protein THAOC_07371, partial [Thalassiosira oceanica]